jgi:hypothetical protein
MRKLQYTCLDDWYGVTKEDIHKHGGRGLLCHYYNNSPSKALLSVYPEYNWKLENFKTKPNKYWKSKENGKKFFDWLLIKLGYKCMDDWYNVTQEDIKKHGGKRLLNGYFKGSPSRALLHIYSEHNWQLERFNARWFVGLANSSVPLETLFES